MQSDGAVIIRKEEERDRRLVEEVIRNAFWNRFEPGATEHFLAHHLRDSADFIPELNLVAETEGRVVGSIMYTTSEIKLDEHNTIPTITFGPLAVDPDYQSRGIGMKLVERSVDIASDMGFNSILIFGDPRYYSKVGFRCAEKYNIRTETGKFAVCLLARPLQEGALSGVQDGIFLESPVFSIADDRARVAAFDGTFSPKEKLSDLPSQKVFEVLRSLSYF